MATEKRLIDANALIESGYDVTLDKVFPDWAELPDATKEAVCKHGQYLKKLIYELPTVDAVEVVHGRWVDRYGDKYANHLYECSECHEKAAYKFEDDSLHIGLWVQDLTDYCPNCGAKMDAEES